MVLFSSSNFFAIFLEFSITRRAGTKRNDNFYFLSFSSFSNLFSFEMKPIMVFFSFSNFFYYFFGIFYFASGTNKTERYFLYSFFPDIFVPILDWNEAIVVFFHFLNFFAILLEFSIMRPAGTKHNDNFYFLSFSSFSILFSLEMKP